MSESAEQPALTPFPEKPVEAPKPEGYGSINGLWTVAVIAVIVGVILFFVSNGSDDEIAKLALGSFSGALLTIGVLCAVAAAVLQGVREMLRRYRTGEPL